jgi:hypothetical protein
MSAAKGRRSLTGADAAGEPQRGFRAVGLTVSKLAAPIVVKRGGGLLVRLKADWSVVVGPEWALTAWPLALGRDRVLRLRTMPSAALELQHRAPLFIERINLYFGRPAVTRLVLIQGTPLVMPEPCGPALGPLLGGDAEPLDRRLSGIADPALRAALGRLARAVIATGR